MTNWPCHMLRDIIDSKLLQAQLGLRRAHCDADLFASQSSYAEFLLALQERGMLKFRRAQGE